MNFLERAWYQKAGWLILLWPLSLMFRMIAALRRKLITPAQTKSAKPIPVVVIGNINVGGTGKTPLILYLTEYFKKEGLKVGVISRGYGGSTNTYPLLVDEDTDVAESGDEAFLIAQRSGCPVVVDPDRNQALEFLLEKNPLDLVLSDDGMQHYRLARDIEIAVVDGQRLFANGFCLPAGPLREGISRLKEVDYIVVNGEPAEQLAELAEASIMRLKPRFLVNLLSKEKRPFSGAPFNMGNRIQAVSGLGNPQRFYQLLEKLPYPLDIHDFADHHRFVESDFDAPGFDDHQPVVMTEKDAVKCRGFARSNFWYLLVDVEVDEPFADTLKQQLQKLRTGKSG